MRIARCRCGASSTKPNLQGRQVAARPHGHDQPKNLIVSGRERRSTATPPPPRTAYPTCSGSSPCRKRFPGGAPSAAMPPRQPRRRGRAVDGRRSVAASRGIGRKVWTCRFPRTWHEPGGAHRRGRQEEPGVADQKGHFPLSGGAKSQSDDRGGRFHCPGRWRIHRYGTMSR